MKKDTFLKKLRKKLSILEETEVNDIIQEYEGYIDEKIESGSTEEDAVSSFGNIDELAQELLSAYKVKAQEEDPIGNFASKIMNILDKLINDISKKTPREILKFFIEIILLILIIALFHIPVSMLVQLGKDVFYILSSPLNRIFYTVWRFILEFAYFILAIIAFVKIFDKRYLHYEEETVVKTEKKTKTKKVNEKKVEPEIKEEKRFISGMAELIIKIGVFFLKFMAICILFGISMYLIGLALVLVLCVYLIVQGVTYFGLYLVMLALFLLGAIFFWLLFNFVLDRKNNGVKLLISLFLSFILLGVGCGIATLEIAETEIINGPPSDLAIEVLQEELTMEKDTIFIGNIADYQVDDTLENIIIEYKYYPVGNKMATDIKKREEKVYLDWTIESLYLRSDFIRQVISDLREKKVYNYYIEPTITIKANEENIETIKTNRQNYYEERPSYSSCDFVRTYYVEMIKDTKVGDTVSVILSGYEEEDLGTVRLDRDIAEDLEVGEYYEFTFKTYQAYIDTNIENIFKDNKVIGVRLTEKELEDQRQDTSCTIFY